MASLTTDVLIQAAENGDVGKVKECIQAGVDLEAKDYVSDWIWELGHEWTCRIHPLSPHTHRPLICTRATPSSSHTVIDPMSIHGGVIATQIILDAPHLDDLCRDHAAPSSGLRDRDTHTNHPSRVTGMRDRDTNHPSHALQVWRSGWPRKAGFWWPTRWD